MRTDRESGFRAASESRDSSVCLGHRQPRTSHTSGRCASELPVAAMGSKISRESRASADALEVLKALDVGANFHFLKNLENYRSFAEGEVRRESQLPRPCAGCCLGLYTATQLAYCSKTNISAAS